MENYFRIALGIVLASTIAITGYHRIQAAQSGERISRKDEGYLFAFALRALGLLLFLATFAYLISPETIQWASLAIPKPIRWLGAFAGLLSSLMMYWTLRSLGKNLTDTVVTRENATLVTDGPYRWVRHPFYVTTAMVMLSVTLLTANWIIGLGCITILAMLAIRTPKEEKALVDRFGQAYRDYMSSTGRFFPRLNSMMSHRETG